MLSFWKGRHAPVEVKDPLKQGLKLEDSPIIGPEGRVEVKDPLKQGLKLQRYIHNSIFSQS